jgi:hypothetical protein
MAIGAGLTANMTESYYGHFIERPIKWSAWPHCENHPAQTQQSPNSFKNS